MTKKRSKNPPVELRSSGQLKSQQKRCTLLRFLSFAGCAGFLLAGIWAAIRQQDNPLILFGYLPEYRFDAVDFERAAQQVSHLALFSLEIDPINGALIPSDRFSASMLNQTRRATSIAGSQLILVLGGAGRSGGFPYLLFDTPMSPQQQQRTQPIAERRRLRFITELCQLIDAAGADGIDINWQWPSTTIELEFLDRLAVEIRKCGPAHFTLSLPVPPALDFVAQVAKLAPSFDYFHWLGYLDPKMSSVSQAEVSLRQVLNILPASKVTLGVPFFGTRGREHLTYEEILRHEDDRDIQWETPTMLLKKFELAKSLNLAGLSIWEIGQDCRPEAVKSHPKTCQGTDQSLLSLLSDKNRNL